MSDNHASHKGAAIKPNTNANDVIDDAANLDFDPQSVLAEGADALRAAEAPENATATERPKEGQEEK